MPTKLKTIWSVVQLVIQGKNFVVNGATIISSDSLVTSYTFGESDDKRAGSVSITVNGGGVSGGGSGKIKTKNPKL